MTPAAAAAASSWMERLSLTWFLCSTLFLAAFSGWHITRNGMSAVGWGSLAIAAALCCVLLMMKRRRLAPTMGIVGLLLGIGTALSNPWNVNVWMENSLLVLQTELQPLQPYEGKSGIVRLTEAERKQQAARIATLTLPAEDDGTRVLVSFRTGLVLIEGNRARYLNAEGSRFMLSTLLPDGSFLYSSMVNPGNIDGRAMNTEGLTRAYIEGDTLRRVWDWRKPQLAMHHWGDEHRNTLYLPGRKFTSLPNSLSAQVESSYSECTTRGAVRDMVDLIDLETGHHLGSIDLLPIILQFEEDGVRMADRVRGCLDPLHLNDIQVVKSQAIARNFPDGKIGDLLISARNIDTVFLLDGTTHELKWHVSDLFRRQHAPRFTDRGTIVVFDNLGSDQEHGRSRVVEIDIRSRAMVGMWEASEGDYFDSSIRGKVLFSNGTVYVQEQHTPKKNATMFALDCPGQYVSMECVRRNIFSGPAPDFYYDNALLLSDRTTE